MKTTSFVDILFYLKKQLKLIIACALIGVLAALIAAKATQGYTATVGIKYAHAGASDGLDPLGGKLDPYEIMAPSLIAVALQNMKSDLSVDEVRNKLSVAAVVASNAKEAQAAKLALGELVEVNTVEYNVSYTCPGKLGSQFAKRLLYNLLQAYDNHFSLKYMQMQRIPDFMQAVDVNNMDYMELCEYIEQQITQISTTLDALIAEDTAYVSLSTGLDFAALRSYYQNMRKIEYNNLYANVRMGLLSKNKNLLVQGYQKRIEDIQLSSANKKDEATQAYEMVAKFYEQYKKNNLYYQARSTQLQTEDNKNDNKNLVFDYDLSLMINTYDDILLRYVDSSVDATNYQHDSDYYARLISEFQADNVSPATKTRLLEQSEKLIAHATELSRKYADLANRTLADYYDYKVANNLKYVMSVEVKANVSALLYVLLGFGIMLLFGCALAVIVEVLKAQMTSKQLEDLLSEESEGNVTAKMLEEMSVMERAFYEQAQNDFPEFYLMYQPIVDMDTNWIISESLVRWNSKRLGQVMPNEFIPIADKYQLMDALGEWIFRKACQQGLEWERKNFISDAVSVNYSVNQIESPSFIDTICRILLETHVNAHKVYLEISGGGELQNVEEVAQKFIALKALGVRLAIDRFGESMSSMRALYELPADMVKVDKKYMAGLGSDAINPFLKEVLSVCKERGLMVCMGGVEAEWQMEQLRLLSVDCMQGFLFSSPLPLAAYEEKLVAFMTNRHGDTVGSKAAPTGEESL